MTNIRDLHKTAKEANALAGSIPVVRKDGKRVALVLSSGRVVVAPDSDVDEVSLEIWRLVEGHIREAWRQTYGD